MHMFVFFRVILKMNFYLPCLYHLARKLTSPEKIDALIHVRNHTPDGSRSQVKPETVK